VNSTACALASGGVLALAGPAMLRQAVPAAWQAPRFGVAAWQLCSVSVVASWMLAALLVTAPAVGVSIATLIAGRLGWAIVTVAWQERRSRRRHIEAVRLVGRRDATLGVTVLDAAVPAVYCVAGRPHTIVMTSGARGALTPRQLDAALAHEHAHLAGRHHLALIIARSFTRAFSRVPVFPLAEREIAALLEVLADDAAARRYGRIAVAQALIGLACGRSGLAVPSVAMPAGGSGVTTRVQRLLAPPRTMGLGETLRSRGLLSLAAAGPLAVLAVPMAVLATHVGSCSMHVL
jgi:Zn-dependent protease with chaperone function